MNDTQNGNTDAGKFAEAIAALPKITVAWDAEKQIAIPVFGAEFKTWGFIASVLTMAADHARDEERFQKLQQRQAMMQQHREAEALRQRLLGGR